MRPLGFGSKTFLRFVFSDSGFRWEPAGPRMEPSGARWQSGATVLPGTFSRAGFDWESIEIYGTLLVHPPTTCRYSHPVDDSRKPRPRARSQPLPIHSSSRPARSTLPTTPPSPICPPHSLQNSALLRSRQSQFLLGQHMQTQIAGVVGRPRNQRMLVWIQHGTCCLVPGSKVGEAARAEEVGPGREGAAKLC